VLSSLSEMHEQSLVHGSLDPQKIIWVKNEATWKLVGLETAVPSGSWSSTKSSPAYASPDVFNSDLGSQKMFKADPSMDMWSLGAIAFELITGMHFNLDYFLSVHLRAHFPRHTDQWHVLKRMRLV